MHDVPGYIYPLSYVHDTESIFPRAAVYIPMKQSSPSQCDALHTVR